MMTWMGATTGSGTDPTHIYNNTANWAGGIIDDSFAGVTLTGNTVLSFNASRSTVAAGLNLDYSGNFNLTLESSSSSAQVLTLGGDITGGFAASQVVTIGDPTNTLNLALGTVGRNINLSTGNTLVVQNVMSGTANVNEEGSGTLTLAGANTNTGGVNLSGGQLNINSATALGSSASRLTLISGTIDNTSGSSVTLTSNNPQTWVGSYTFGGSSSLNMGSGAVTLGNSVVVTTSANTLTEAGIISDGGSGYSVTKAGAGALTLSGVNTFSGGIILSAGQLNINNAKALGASAGTFNIAGGTIDNTSGSLITLSNTNPETWGGNFTFIGSSALSLGTGAVTLTANRTVTLNGSLLTVAGVISGAYSLTKAGAGTLLLSGANTFNGGINLSGGQLDINSASALGTGTFTISGGTTIDSTAAAVTETNNNAESWGGNFTYAGTFALNMGSGAVALGSNVTVTANTTAVTLTAGAVGDAGNHYSLTKAGSGTLTLGVNGTFSGGTLISAGILNFANGALGTGNISFTGSSTLQWATGNTQDISSKIQAIPTGVIATLDTIGNVVPLAGAISGAGSIKKVGTGTLTLSGTNTFTGGINLSAGLLDINSATALGTGTFTIGGGTIDNTSGATVTDSNNNAMVWGASFAFTGSNNLNLGTGAVTLTATPTVTANAYNLSIGGIVSGAFGLTKAGNGTLVLAGANTYTGTTTLSAGQITINNATALGTGTFSVGTAKIDNTTGSSLTLTNNNVITLAGTLTFVGSNALNLGTGTATMTAAATITTTASTLTVPGVISGAFLLTKSGNGTLLLPTNNTFSGGLKLSAGILDLNNAGAFGTGTFNISGGTIDNTSGSPITLNSNVVALAGSFAFTGTNNLTFGTGTTTITANSKTITVNGGTLAFPSVIGDGGLTYKLTVAGAGTLVLSGANTFGGGVGLTVATLDINNAKAVGTGTLTIGSGTIDNTSGAPITLANNNAQSWSGTFAVRGTNNLNLGTGTVALTNTTTINTSSGTFMVGGIISGAKSLTKTGAGTLLLTGVNTYSLGTTVSAGTLLVNNASGSGTGTGAVTVSSGGTLGGTGIIGGAVTVNSGGTLSPGSGGPSSFNTGNLALASGSTLSIVINGNTAGSAYSQVNVTGTVSVNGSNLNISGSRIGHDGTVLTLINNDAADAITGTFAGLAQGASTAALNGVTYNSNYSGGTGNDFTLTAATAASSTTITSGTNPSIYNQSITLTATVTSPATNTPTGTVTFFNAGTTLGTAALNGSAVATLSIATLPVGSDALTASYSGDTNFSVSTSSPYNQTVTAGPPAMVVYTQQPSTVAAGTTDNPAIAVAVEDQYGNIVTTSTSAVTLAVASGPGGASGTLTASAVAGIASFNNVVFSTSGVYRLTATDGSFTSATSGNFTVTSGQPRLVYIQQPSATTAGAAESPSIVVQIQDQFGNIITTDNSTITLAVAAGPAGASGTLAVAASSGVATFSNVTLTTAGTYALTANDGALTPINSSSFAVSVAAASQLVYVQQTSSVTAGVANSPSIAVDVEDAYGNLITTDNSTVTLAVGSGPGSATGTLSVAAVNGIATFNNVELNTAGVYTLTASDGGLTLATSNSLTVTPAAASQVAFSQQPGDVVAGVMDNPALVVNVEDQYGNIVTNDSSMVSLAVASGPGNAGGTLTAAAVGGTATFSNAIFNTAGAYTLAATDGTLATATSTSFNVTAAAASQVAFAQLPGTATVNAAISPSINVNIEDQFGNIVTTDSSTVTLVIGSGPGSASGTLSAVASGGVATFSNVILNTVGSYTLSANDGALSSATSASFTVNPAAASQLVYAQAPSNSIAGAAISPSIIVDVEDQYGNIESADSSTVSLAVASGPGSAGGTLTVSAVNGVATFNSAQLTIAGVYTLTASDAALTSVTSVPFTITPASVSQVVFVQQPNNVTAGIANSPSIVADVEDQFGNVVTTNSSTVTIAIASGPAAASGTLTATASGGVATFSNVILNTAGSYTLTSSDSALASATSSSFTVTPAAASHVVYSRQPSAVIAGAIDSPSITVSVEDQFGNVVTTDSSSVTLAVAAGPGVASGSLTATAANGVATFASMKFVTSGNYTLNASDGSLTSATSSSFSVTPAASSQLIYSRQPSNVIAGVANTPSIIVNVEDQYGNIETTDTSTVTIAVATGAGSASGTLTAAAVAGMATLTNVKLNTAGSYTLIASDGALTAVTSNSFTVSPAAASQVAYFQQPSGVLAGAADSPSITVKVEDQFENVVTTDSSSVIVAVVSGPGSASGTLTAAASGGLATFSNVKFNTSGSYTLTVTDTGLVSATSGSFTVAPASASKLVFIQQPNNVTAGVADAPSLVVDVQDQFGNVVATDSSAVTITVASGPESAGGTLAVAAVNGVATFGNVKLNTAGTYTLSASDGGLTSATSGTFVVGSAAASQLVYAIQPGNATAGAANSPAIVVDVEDQFGNIVSTDSSSVTLGVATGPGAAGGSLTAAAVNGVATFGNVQLNTAGAYILAANDGSLTSASSGSFTITAAAASKVVFARQPSGAVASIANSPSITVDVEDQFGNIVTTNSSAVTLAAASGPAAASGTLTVTASNGVATFGNMILTTAATYTLAASDSALTSVISSSFTVTPAAASHLVYGQQPGAVSAGAADSLSITVKVEDPFGNVVTTDSSSITLAVATGPGIASGTLSANASTGIATFANVRFVTSGSYTIAATDGALISATSGSFAVTPAASSQLVYSRQPSNVTAGVVNAPSIIVNIEDQYGNLETADTSNVTIAVATGAGAASGTLMAAAVGGVATLTNVKLTSAGAHTLIATDGALTAAISASFTVNPAAASQLVYSQQPSNAVAGVATSPTITLDVEDPYGNIVTTDSSNVTVAVANGPGSASGSLTSTATNGVATLGNVKFNTTGTYTLTASDGSLTTVTSGNFNVVPASASQLVYAVQPSNGTAGVANSPSIVVDVEDPFGNVVAADNSNVTIAVTTGPGMAGGTLSAAAVNGVATLNNVQLDIAGSYNLSASDGSLASANSNSFTISPAAASQVVFAQQPSNVVAGLANSPSITVDVEDQFGNIVDTDNSTVAISVCSGPAAASGTLTAAAANGVATFNNVIFDTVGTYTLTVAEASLTSVTSSSFIVTPADSYALAFAQQPADVMAGVADAPSISVEVLDQHGNVVTDDSSVITLVVSSGPGTASGTLSVAAVGGIATFNDVQLDMAGTYTLVVSDGGLTSANSSSFAVSPAAASQIVFDQQPSDVVADVADSPAITADVEDPFGNIVTTDSSDITLAVASGSGAASGTLIETAVDGVATFGNAVFTTAGNYSLNASDNGLTPATSGGFVVMAASASKLVFTQQPSDVTAGAADAPSIVVDVEDQFGNVVETDASTVTIAATNDPGSAFGTLAVAAVNGVASFGNLELETAGAYTLTTSDGGLTSATSGSFNVTSAQASQLVYSQQPVGVVAGDAESPSIVVELQDSFGNVVTTDSSLVTLAVATGPGAIAGTMTVAATNGIAIFDNVSFDAAGNYTLGANDGALPTVISGSFTVTPAAASQLVFNQQPDDVVAGSADSPSIVVEIEDQFGNVVTTDNSTVTLDVATGPTGAGGTLSVAASGGVATFNHVILTTVGTYTLTAGDGVLAPGISSSFSVTPTGASQLDYAQQPTDVTAGVANVPSIVIDIEDAYGNLVTADNSTVTIAIANGPGNASGTLSVAAIDGAATFSDLELDAAGTYTLSASDNGLTPVTSNSLTVSPAAASQLSFVQQPGNAVAGAVNSPAITVNVLDQFGNLVTTDSSTVTLSVGSGPGNVGETLTVAAVNGLAAFSNVVLEKSGIYTLTTADGALASATSASFIVVPAAAAQVVFSQQPGDVVAGAADSPSIVINVEDAYGNLVTVDGSTVTLAVGTGPGIASGGLTATAVNGMATFADVELDTAGNYTLTASDSGLTAATSLCFTVTPASTSQLVFVQQPGDVVAGVAESPAIVVEVEDQFGNLEASDASLIALTAANSPGSASGTVSVNAQGGVATFSNLDFDVAGSYVLTAADGSLSPATSGSFTVTPAAPAALAFVQQPTDVTAGADINPAIVVDVEDQFGNVVATDSSTVSITVASGPDSAFGIFTINTLDGVATLTDVTLNTAGDYSLSATDGSLASATSTLFTVNPAAASQLVYSQQPSNGVAGMPDSPAIAVNVEDPYGNIVTGDDSTVTLTVASGPGAPTGTMIATASNGVATFDDVTFETSGSYSLMAMDGGLTSVTSNNFMVTSSSASKLVYVQPPSDAFAGVIDIPAIVLHVEDQYGNIVASDNSTVTLAVAEGPDSAAVSGMPTATAVDGVVTFNDVQFATPGNYMLTASDGGLMLATSPSFTISSDPTSIALTPANSSSVFGQTVVFTATATNFAGGAIPTGVMTFMEGSVTLGNATLDNSGTAIFRTSAAMIGANAITAAYQGDADCLPSTSSASALSVSEDATTTSVNASTSPAVFRQGVTFTATVSANQPGSGVPTGLVTLEDGASILGTATLDSSGIASFATAALPAGNHLIVAVYDGDANCAGSASTAMNLPVTQTATTLVVTRQAANGVAGQTLGAIQINIEDAFGKLVTGDASSVTLTSSTAVGGTTMVTAVNGVVTFSDLSIDQAGNFTFTFADGSLASATSSSITIIPAPAARLILTNQPNSAAFEGESLGTINVEVVDAYGNLVTTDNSMVTLSGGVGLSGSTSTAAQGGLASFSDLSFTTTGTFVMTATDGGLASVTTDPVTINATHSAIAGASIAPILIDANTLFPQSSQALTLVKITITNQSANSSKPISRLIRLKLGQAMLSGIKLPQAGKYTLTISDRHGQTTTEQIVVAAAVPAKLVFENQPVSLNGSEVITLAVVDRFGNYCSLDNSTTVTLILNSNRAPGVRSVLTGPTTVSVIAGFATFTNIAVNHPGRGKLMATAAGLASATSHVFQYVN